MRSSHQSLIQRRIQDNGVNKHPNKTQRRQIDDQSCPRQEKWDCRTSENLNFGVAKYGPELRLGIHSIKQYICSSGWQGEAHSGWNYLANMLKPPVTHRLAQQTWTPRTWTPRRLNTRALSPSRGSTGRFSQRWQHSNPTTINGRSSAAIASAADGKTIGHPPGDACNGKGQATQASGERLKYDIFFFCRCTF